MAVSCDLYQFLEKSISPGGKVSGLYEDNHNGHIYSLLVAFNFSEFAFV
jgi:hypothetical protein